MKKLLSFVLLLFVIVACERGSSDVPVTDASKAVQPSSSPPAEPKEASVADDVKAAPAQAPAQAPASPPSDCEGGDQDICDFRKAVKMAVGTQRCIEEKSSCAKDRGLSACIAQNDAFGCRKDGSSVISLCAGIKNDSTRDSCYLAVSFPYDSLEVCKSISDPELKDMCLYSFLDRIVDCKAANFPCRTALSFKDEDCVFSKEGHNKVCQGIARQDKDLCYQGSLPGACDLIFAPMMEYDYQGAHFSRLLSDPSLDPALAWLKENTQASDVILADWSHGHMIRAKAQRDAFIWNPPDSFKPGEDDAKDVYMMGSYVLRDAPYYDTASWGPLASQDKAKLMADIFLSKNVSLALPLLKSNGIKYVLVDLADLDNMDLYLAVSGLPDVQSPLIAELTSRSDVDGLSLVFEDQDSAIYSVD